MAEAGSTKRRRDISPASQRHMQAERRSSKKKQQEKMDRLHAARKASWETTHSDRCIRKAMTCLVTTLPPVHELRKDISEEQSQSVLRIFATLYEALYPDRHWYSRAVASTASSTGVCERQVREIWKHFESTGEFYHTERPTPPPTPEEEEQHVLARDFLELELPRLASRGMMRSTKGVQRMLKTEFGMEASKYRVKKLLEELGYSYRDAKQDWTVGMKSARRQRQLLLHLLLLDQALKEVDKGTAILLFTDQSFIDTCTHMRMGYVKEGTTHARFPKGTGVRVAHMHALTAYGLLAVNDDDGNPVSPPSQSDGIRGQRAKSRRRRTR